MTPNELIKAILKAPVDLLWNGGIGTYVKSTQGVERATSATARTTTSGSTATRCAPGSWVKAGTSGSPSVGTDRVRAGRRPDQHGLHRQLRPASTPPTTRSTWKILLGLAVVARRAHVGGAERAAPGVRAPTSWSTSCTTTTCRRRSCSQELDFSVERNDAYEDLMQQLVADGELEREVEFLPSSEEMLERRANGPGHGATGARGAARLREAFDRRASSSDPTCRTPNTCEQNDLRRYFPPAIVERFGHLIPEHPLKRELIATIVANDIVNSVGITFVSRMVTETGSHPADVVRAYRIARDVTGAVERWEAIEALDGVIDPRVQGELMRGVDYLVETASRWYLVQSHGERLSEAIDDSAGVVRGALVADLADRSGAVARGARARRAPSGRRGCPEEIARRHAFQGELVHGPDIIAVAHATGWEVDAGRARVLHGRRAASVSTGSSIDWNRCPSARTGSAGPRSRWRTTCSLSDVSWSRR